jgi:hypothetical protein
MRAGVRLTQVGAFLACMVAPAIVYGQSDRFDALANLPFEQGRPTQATAQTSKDELLFQRAAQTYLWAMPLINTLGMKNGAEAAFGTGYKLMPIWTKRLDAKTHITTPNSDLILSDLWNGFCRPRPDRAAGVRCAAKTPGHPA